MEPVTKRIEVTFRDGLPLGTNGMFRYDGRKWIAQPFEKHIATLTVTDRLIGVLDNIREQMTQWVAAHPGDAERVVMLLNTIARADEIARQATIDKAEAQTS